MPTLFYKSSFILLFFIATFPVDAQCDIKNRLGSDETLYYYIEPVQFYWTNKSNLSGNIVTDKEYYFLSLFPFPLPSKESEKKMKDSLEIELSNHKNYNLEYYYSNFVNDTLFEIMYRIDKNTINDFLNFQVNQVNINMGGTEGVRTYHFKLHKDALKDQLKCLLNNDKKKQ